jgi:hypothetical protein
MSGAADRAVLILARDLFFRAKLEAAARAGGATPVATGRAPVAVVELSGESSVQRIRELVAAGTRVLAFGSHVRVDWLRAARDAGAVAVPNSRVEETVRQWLERLED